MVHIVPKTVIFVVTGFEARSDLNDWWNDEAGSWMVLSLKVDGLERMNAILRSQYSLKTIHTSGCSATKTLPDQFFQEASSIASQPRGYYACIVCTSRVASEVIDMSFLLLVEGIHYGRNECKSQFQFVCMMG